MKTRLTVQMWATLLYAKLEVMSGRVGWAVVFLILTVAAFVALIRCDQDEA